MGPTGAWHKIIMFDNINPIKALTIHVTKNNSMKGSRLGEERIANTKDKKRKASTVVIMCCSYASTRHTYNP